jgi:3-dehydroquinate synthase
VDSSVGGKTGVNHPLGKNMIGAFYQPICVLADTDVLSTLPRREVKAGLAEVLKYGLIYDAGFFDWLEANSQGIGKSDSALLSQIIRTCCEIKAEIVAKDERESGVRAMLNFGHTFGHAIETASGYSNWLHGETVVMGMVMAADLSHKLGWIDLAVAQRIRAVLEENFGMPVLPPTDISVEQYLDLMLSDKKAESGKIRFVLLKAIGEGVVDGDIEPSLLESTLTAGDNLCM